MVVGSIPTEGASFLLFWGLLLLFECWGCLYINLVEWCVCVCAVGVAPAKELIASVFHGGVSVGCWDEFASPLSHV